MVPRNKEWVKEGAASNTDTVIETKELTKFFGGVRAVHDFSLRVTQGEMLGLIGPNGAGKTTVFNLITGVYHPTKGQVLYRDAVISGLEPHVIASLGVIRTFQNIRLFPNLSVVENVKIAHAHRRQSGLASSLFRTQSFLREENEMTQEAEDLLRRFGLVDRKDEIVKFLPYGEQRRVEIVRAMASSPSVLLLDEPAAGMNPSEVDSLMDLIRWVKSEFNLTVLIIEHQMRMIMRLCPRIRVMDFGETIIDGTPEEVRADVRVISAYLGRRAKDAVGS